MNKKILSTVITLLLVVSSTLSGCGNSSTVSNADKSKSKVQIEDNDIEQDVEKEIIPNDPSDFKWREITVDEDPHNAGCIMITGYVGKRNDIVIPKSISDKPVVAIAPFAFCPYTEDELTYYNSLDPYTKLFKLVDESDLVVSDYKNEKDAITAYLKEHDTVSPITSIMIPHTIEYMLFLAFGFCDNLERVEVYDTDGDDIPLIYCDGSPFFANTKLKNYNFYLSDENYGSIYCFEYCINLENINLYPDEDGVVSLSWINTTSNVKSIHIAEGTTYLSGIVDDGGQFSTHDPIVNYNNNNNIIFECSADTIYLPASLTEIQKHTFCTHLPIDLDNMYISEIEELECTEYASTIIIAPQGSYAESYAKDCGITCFSADDEIDSKIKKRIASEQSEKLEAALIRKENLENDDLYALYIMAKRYCYGYWSDFFCVISSDKDKNYNFDKIFDKKETFDNYNYFIVCDSGKCTYVVMEGKDTGNVRTYPENTVYKYQGEYKSFNSGDYSFDELYSMCMEEIKANNTDIAASDSNTAVIKAEGGLNMRSGAGQDYDKVTLIPDGSTVEVIEEDGEWTKVKYNSYTGWVKNSYLR